MNEISATTRVEEILTKYPSLSRTFIELGMPCLVCGEPFWGTVAELSKQYGANCEELIRQLNEKALELDERS